MAISLLVVTLVVVFVINTQFSNTEVTSPANSARLKNQDPWQFDAFRQMLAKSNRAQLFELLETVQLDKTEELPLLLEKLRKQIAIAERIVEVSSGRAQTDQANALLLDKLREFETMLFAEGIEPDKSNLLKIAKLIGSSSEKFESGNQKGCSSCVRILGFRRIHQKTAKSYGEKEARHGNQLRNCSQQPKSTTKI